MNRKTASIGAIFLGLILALGFHLYLPTLIEHRIEREALKKNIELDITKLDLNYRSGMNFLLQVNSPAKIENVEISLHWNFSNIFQQIPFVLTAGSGKYKYKDFDTKISSLRLEFVWNYKNFNIKDASVDLELMAPVQAQIKVSRQIASSDAENYAFSIKAPAQDLSPLTKDLPLHLQKKLNVSGTFTQLNGDVKGNFYTHEATKIKFNYEGLPAIISLRKLTGPFEFTDSEPNFPNLDIDFTSEYDGASLSFKSGSANIDLRRDVFSINLEGKLKTNFSENSLKQYLKLLDIDFLEKPVGFLNADIKITTKDDTLEFESLWTGAFKRITLAALPVQGVNIRTRLHCFTGRKTKGTCYPASFKHQISAESVGGASPLTNLKLEIHTQKSKLRGNFSASWLGAKIEDPQIIGFYERGKSEILSNLKVTNLDLAKLSKVLDMDSLKATGTVEGQIALQFSPEGFVIPPSQIQSIGEGWIYYKDPSIKDLPKNIETLKEFNTLMAQGQQALVYKALDNFKFKKMVIDVARPKPKDMRIKLHLDGANPELARGQVFDISIPIEGNIEGLLAERSFERLAESETSEEYVKKLRKALAK